MDFPRIVVDKRAKLKIDYGYLWIFRGALSKVENELQAGIVVIEDKRGRFLGYGDYNPESNIAIRVLTRGKRFVEEDFFRSKLTNAFRLRKRIYPDEDSYRVVFSEGDFVPGLIIDKYKDGLVIQPLTAAMEKRKNLIINLCIEIFNPAFIVDRSDNPSRKHEGLELYKNVIYGELPDKLIIRDGPIHVNVDPLKGEKTGYFFDQRDNRRLLRYFVEGKHVLDVFSYTGGFTVHSIIYGAKHVTAVEISDKAIDSLKKNLEINGITQNVNIFKANAFDFLKEQSNAGKKYEIIILDPPAFTKSKSSIDTAYRGYKEINLRALKMLSPGGFLFTFSCSYHMSLERFLYMLSDAASDLKINTQIIKVLGQSSDHPILTSMPETKYLKGVVLRVVSH